MQQDPEIDIIVIVINSYGGEIYELISMLDLIAACSKPVATIGMGKAMSCGSVLLVAGTPGYRFVSPNTDIMVHEVSSEVRGKNIDIQNDAKQTKRLNSLLFKLYSKYAKNKDSKFFIKQLKSRQNIDWYITAANYKRYGLVDHLFIPKLWCAK